MPVFEKDDGDDGTTRSRRSRNSSERPRRIQTAATTTAAAANAKSKGKSMTDSSAPSSARSPSSSSRSPASSTSPPLPPQMPMPDFIVASRSSSNVPSPVDALSWLTQLPPLPLSLPSSSQPQSPAASSASSPVGTGNTNTSRHGNNPSVTVVGSNTLLRRRLKHSLDPNNNKDDSLNRNTTTGNRQSRRRSIFKRSEDRVGWWVITSRAITFYLPSFVLALWGKHDPTIQQAFREKLALCTIIFFLMFCVAFLTFGFTTVLCPNSRGTVSYASIYDTAFGIHGKLYNYTRHSDPHAGITVPNGTANVFNTLFGTDISNLFQPVRGQSSCDKLPAFPDMPCTIYSSTGATVWPPSNISSGSGCHNKGSVDFSQSFDAVADLTVLWEDVKNHSTWLVFNAHVLNVGPLLQQSSSFQSQTFGLDTMKIITENIGKDATLAFAMGGKLKQAQCLVELFRIATVDFKTPGCIASQVVLIVSFAVIGGVVIARFLLALYFTYVIGWKLGHNKAYAKAMEEVRMRRAEQADEKRLAVSGDPETGATEGSRPSDVIDIPLESILRASNVSGARYSVSSRPLSNIYSNPSVGASPLRPSVDEPTSSWKHNFGFMEMDGPTVDTETERVLSDPTLMHTIVMVPCYSEGEESLRATLDSVAKSYYPSTHKCLFVVADGIVKGSDNLLTTPDILIDMIEVDERFRRDDPRWGGEPEAYTYVAIADGNKRKNYAKVYAGWYRHHNASTKTPTNAFGGGSSPPSSPRSGDANPGAQMRTIQQRTEGRVPMLLIVKVGNEEERDVANVSKKPGNRGKRDSQIILMNFLSKVMFDDRMTELEFDIFFKLFTITGVNPERYEGVLMVDADTRVYPDSLTHMVACLLRDHRVMGLCGETKILNKWESWVTMIQVFEYFVSHHLSKAFESVFGGVTCLPGCFSMYRIKTPKGPNGHWVPILANPDVVEEYSENVVDTLHKKNLLLLGEDRFLSTMMLRNFPKRRMVFVPPAICKTVVPNTFKILLSQRRRWINSTVHNLMELVLVKDLCGTFCISMQFVIFMELVGTVVLPAAITFTLVLCAMALANVIHPGLISTDFSLPLYLLAGILGLPAVLILMTANKVIYIFWMFIYILSLPIWNFVLPLYAFWHFDDFSWGETRKVKGEVKGADHSGPDGEFDSTGINMKRWREWVAVRRVESETTEAERARGMAYNNSRAVASMYQISTSLPASPLPTSPSPISPREPGRARQQKSSINPYAQSLPIPMPPQEVGMPGPVTITGSVTNAGAGSHQTSLPPGVVPPAHLLAPAPAVTPPLYALSVGSSAPPELPFHQDFLGRTGSGVSLHQMMAPTGMGEWFSNDRHDSVDDGQSKGQ